MSMMQRLLRGEEAALYVEDVFSTYLYTGNGSTQTITNGINLSGKGGLVWLKDRNAANGHFLTDTLRGVNSQVSSNSTAAATTNTNMVTAFNSNGFSLGASGDTNNSTNVLASWTFREAPKFFDVVTYTGDGSTTRAISHSLGTTPGMIIVKCTNTSATNWAVYHRGLNGGSSPHNYILFLNDTMTQAGPNSVFWGGTAPTSTTFSVGNYQNTNLSGYTYVAYLFAHDATATGIIQCGAVTLDGSGNASVNLGWEPQSLTFKASSTTSNWYMADNMRGLGASSVDMIVYANASSSESGPLGSFKVNATGFTVTGLVASATYIYLAIRRGPMRTPTAGTQVFMPIARAGTGGATNVATGLSAQDLIFTVPRNAPGNNWYWNDRLRGGLVSTVRTLQSNTTTAEGTTGAVSLNGNTQDQIIYASNAQNQAGTNYLVECLKRAPGFFDVVCDTGTGSAHTISHNLGVVPELMIRKKRSAADNWVVYAGDATDYLIFNSTDATTDLDTMWNDTAPTASVFTVGTNDDVNESTGTFVTYLFASLPGVSKIGTYTGNGSATGPTVSVGFQPRLLIIKRTDSTSGWGIWDSARSTSNPRANMMQLNDTAEEIIASRDVDFNSSNFQIKADASAMNANGGTYLYMAIA